MENEEMMNFVPENEESVDVNDVQEQTDVVEETSISEEAIEAVVTSTANENKIDDTKKVEN